MQRSVRRPATDSHAAWPALGLVVLAALAAGCGNPDGDGKDAGKAPADATTTTDAPVTTPDAVPEIPVGGICAPGTTDGCFNSTTVKRCTDDGKGYAAVECLSDEGQQTLCVDPGVCFECTLGAKRCSAEDSTAVEECGDQGKWEIKEHCDAGQGLQCTASGLCQKACDINAKAKSYVGCAFWAADLDNAFVPGGKRSYYDAAGAQFAVVVSNPSDKLSTKITIENSEGEVLHDAQFNELDFSPLAPGELRTFNLPARNINATTQEPLAYRITSSSPIAAYQFNPLENVNVYSNDASLLLPQELLGKFYIVMSREQSFSILRGFVTVVSPKGNGHATKVTVSFGKTSGRSLSGTIKKAEKGADGKPTGKVLETPIKSFEATESAEFTLDEWDVLNLESDQVGSDLTGTVILADKPVAVFAGSEAANVPNTNHCLKDACSAADVANGKKCGVCEWDGKTPCGNNEHCSAFITCCADHLEMQMFPVKTWGHHYVGVKLFPRGKEADSWRILAATDGTKVALNPPQKDPKGKPINIPVLDAGEWFEFEADCGPGYKKGDDSCLGGSFEVVAVHDDGSPAPILLGHFMASQDAPEPNSSGAQQQDAGTGDPAFLLSIPTGQWREDFVFLTPNKYAFNYISIAAPTDATVEVDGSVVSPELWQAASKNYKYTRLFVNPGTHVVKSAKVDNQPRPVAVDVYGFDQYVSYGYPAGLDLKDLLLVKEPGE